MLPKNRKDSQDRVKGEGAQPKEPKASQVSTGVHAPDLERASIRE